jgi:hypothetical protein
VHWCLSFPQPNKPKLCSVQIFMRESACGGGERWRRRRVCVCLHATPHNDHLTRSPPPCVFVCGCQVRQACSSHTHEPINELVLTWGSEARTLGFSSAELFTLDGIRKVSSKLGVSLCSKIIKTAICWGWCIMILLTNVAEN